MFVPNAHNIYTALRCPVQVLAKHLMLVKLGLTEGPSPEQIQAWSAAAAAAKAETAAAADGAEGASTAAEEEAEEVTDPDVLSLPPVGALAAHLGLWMPTPLTARTELAIKRAVVSCLDLLADAAPVPAPAAAGGNGAAAAAAVAGRLEVEDVVARAADAAPTTEFGVKLLRQALNAATAEFDTVIKREKELVKRLGGLYVIGTARHESRRIDNQLRGRAGRQGDPGGTRFFLSLDDDMFKVQL